VPHAADRSPLRARRTFEAIGDNKVRVTCPTWDDAKVILADQSLEVTWMGKPLVAARFQRALEFLNVELNGLAAAGYGPETKRRVTMKTTSTERMRRTRRRRRFGIAFVQVEMPLEAIELLEKRGYLLMRTPASIGLAITALLSDLVLDAT
jgi:hypothetical protein